MTTITINGKSYELAMTIHAMEDIEEEFGDLKSALEKFRQGNRNVRIIKAMFRILANAGRYAAGKPEDVTGDEVNNLTLAGLNSLALKIREAMDASMHAETVAGGLADDEEADVYAEEMEKQSKNG